MSAAYLNHQYIWSIESFPGCLDEVGETLGFNLSSFLPFNTILNLTWIAILLDRFNWTLRRFKAEFSGQDLIGIHLHSKAHWREWRDHSAGIRGHFHVLIGGLCSLTFESIRLILFHISILFHWSNFFLLILLSPLSLLSHLSILISGLLKFGLFFLLDLLFDLELLLLERLLLFSAFLFKLLIPILLLTFQVFQSLLSSCKLWDSFCDHIRRLLLWFFYRLNHSEDSFWVFLTLIIFLVENFITIYILLLFLRTFDARIDLFLDLESWIGMLTLFRWNLLGLNGYILIFVGGVDNAYLLLFWNFISFWDFELSFSYNLILLRFCRHLIFHGFLVFLDFSFLEAALLIKLVFVLLQVFLINSLQILFCLFPFGEWIPFSLCFLILLQISFAFENKFFFLRHFWYKLFLAFFKGRLLKFATILLSKLREYLLWLILIFFILRFLLRILFLIPLFRQSRSFLNLFIFEVLPLHQFFFLRLLDLEKVKQLIIIFSRFDPPELHVLLFKLSYLHI